MRFLAAPLLFFFLACPLAFASSNTSPGSEQPPSAPDASTTVFARAVFSNGSPIASSSLVMLVRTNQSSTTYRMLTDPSGRVILSLKKGSYEVDSLLDLPSTPGVDFASTASLEVPSEGNATLIFYPSGSLAGRVLASGSPVPNALIRVSCPSSAFDYSRINGGVDAQAGEAGDFLFRALPAGTCIVSASAGSLAGSSEAQVSPGQVSSALVEMKRKAETEGSVGLLPILIACVGALALAAIWLYSRKRDGAAQGAPGASRHAKPGKSADKKEEEGIVAPAKQAPYRKADAQPEEEKFNANSPKAKAVLATLSDREREIVRFLFKCNGRAKRSQMQHKLLIPKTSLLRNLRSLERKNIVKLTPFGRNLLAEIEDSIFS
jgi:uncharacterized membrane protein